MSSGRTRRRSHDWVLIDMNTQCDFLLPKGALPVANRADALPNIRRVMNWGRVGGTPIMSSLECHRPGESLNGFPAHCVDRTNGQKKLPFTLMPRRIVLHGDNTLDLPHDPFRRYQQIIFTKRNGDFLSNPKADRLVNSISVRCFVVFGVLVEHCVKLAVLGLLARRRQVVVVRDACGHWCASGAELAFRQMFAKGAIVVTTEELITDQVEAKLAARPVPAEAEEETTAAKPGNGNGHGDDQPTDQVPGPRNGNGRKRSSAGGMGEPHQDMSELVAAARRKLRAVAQRQARSRQRHV